MKKVSEEFYLHSCGAVVEQERDCPFHSASPGPLPQTLALSEPVIGETSNGRSPSAQDPAGKLGGPVSPKHVEPPFSPRAVGQATAPQDSSLLEWADVPVWTSGVDYKDPSLKSALEEVAGREGFPPNTIPVTGGSEAVTRPTEAIEGGVERLPDLMPAEANELEVRQLIADSKGNLLRIGVLLLANYENAWWSVAGKWENWKDFLNSLGLASYSWMTRLVGAARLLNDGKLTAQEIDEIGLGKVAMLLPHRDQLTPELISLAKDGPPQDLREALAELGSRKLRKATEEGRNVHVTCPRCGAEFMWEVKA